MNDTTASALAYGFNKKQILEETNVLIFDLGGGTFDASLVTIEDDIFEVKATAGDAHLGGEDFNNRMVDHFVKEFKRKHNKDMRTSRRAIHRLRTSCERAKRTLASNTQAYIEIDSLFEGIDFSATISRELFEELNMNYFLKCMEHIEKVIEDSKVPKDQIHEIVLVGGSSRIPRMQSMLSDFFDGKQPNSCLNPDEAVVYGATIQAAILSGCELEMVNEIIILETSSISIGFENAGGVMGICLKRNTSISTKQSQMFTTYSDTARPFLLLVYEGEGLLTCNCHLLGKFEIKGIAPMPRGQPEVEVTLKKDENGLLCVSALEMSTGKPQTLEVVRYAHCNLSDQEISSMILEKNFQLS